MLAREGMHSQPVRACLHILGTQEAWVPFPSLEEL